MEGKPRAAVFRVGTSCWGNPGQTMASLRRGCRQAGAGHGHSKGENVGNCAFSCWLSQWSNCPLVGGSWDLSMGMTGQLRPAIEVVLAPLLGLEWLLHQLPRV